MMTDETDKAQATNTSQDSMAYFRPSQFMRGRRPEQFSDSHEIPSPSLDKSFFEYHLKTLTNRSDEKPFEHFCRQLAQKEICPNLLPQTGPTGGGDSKVDTETYPVAPEIAERWYEGDQRAAGERWAFAISAKKDWKPKVKSDVLKIAATGRGYTKIYFISNQFIRDKVRADTETELTSKCGIEVRILDRNWIVERVFTNKHFALAIDALNIAVNAPQKRVRTGPLDTKRQQQIEELESQIVDQTHYKGIEYQLAEDCLRAAMLGRELELSRDRVDTLFARAKRIAEKVDSRQQRLRIAYQHAWTLCYWFDDFEALNKQYHAIEELALASDNANDLEMLTNVWTSVFGGLRAGAIRPEDAKIQERANRLKAELLKLGSQPERPNNAAHARSLLCIMAFIASPQDTKVIGKSLREFVSILQESEHLGGYPFDQYAVSFEELGDIFGSHPDYDQCFELVLNILERRRSKGAAGLALLKRGRQKIEVEDYYNGIRFLGRAHVRLIKAEHQRDLVFCLINEAHAYEQVDLLWAAHSCLLAAAAIALSNFISDGRVSGQALRSIQQLVWLEIRLGRMPHILGYQRFQSVLAAHCQMGGDALEKYNAQARDQDFVLSMFFLRLSIEQLRNVELLPETLAQSGLHFSAMSLLYALGQLDALRDEGYVSADMTGEALDAMMCQLSEQPAKSSLPEIADLYDHPNIILKSNVLGCKWKIITETEEISVHIGEALLGFIEAFFATSLVCDAIPYRSDIDIGIFKSKDSVAQCALQIILSDDDYLVRIEYTDSYDPSKEASDGTLSKFLKDLLPNIIARVLFVPDIGAYLQRIAEIEEGFARSLAFSDVYTSANNVLGNNSIHNLSGWLGKKRYPLLRKSIVIARSIEKLAEEEHQHTPRFSPADAEQEPPDQSHLKHSQRAVLSMIETALWDEAEWQAVALVGYPDCPPFLALVFKNEEPAQRIFAKWRKRLGKIDENDLLRISILTGVDALNPFAYSLHISTNLDEALKGLDCRSAIFVSRWKKMEPANGDTMQKFFWLRQQYGCYFLAPAVMPINSFEPKLLPNDRILKRNVIVRAAWEIGINDQDIIILGDENEPPIPPGIENPPIKQALEWLKSKRHTG